MTRSRATPQRALWRCPRCGTKLVTARQWHSCGRFSLKALFAGSMPGAAKTFRALRAAVLAEVRATVIPQKSRVAFQLRTRFMAVYPRKDHVVVGFVFRQKRPHARIHRIEGPISGAWVHYVRLAAAEDVDATIRRWIRQAIPYGRQA